MPTIASVAIDVKLNLDPAKRQITDFGHSGGRIAGGQFERGFSDHIRSSAPRMNSLMTGVSNVNYFFQLATITCLVKE
jgi:hypothetical protein